MLQHDRFFVPQRQEKLQFCCAHLHGQAPRVPSRLLWQEFRHVHVNTQRQVLYRQPTIPWHFQTKIPWHLCVKFDEINR